MASLILVLLLVAFVCSRLMRSTRIWWACLSAILAGLLVGILSKEAQNKSLKNEKASITQLTNFVDHEDSLCTQSLVDTVTESATALPNRGCESHKRAYVTRDQNAFVNRYLTRGRDSPQLNLF